MTAPRLFDNHQRPINYVRLAVTDRCNLRCFYCMPEKGVRYLPKKELLTNDEIQRLVEIMADMGITKVRLTGGEPFVRHDIMELIETITATKGIEEVHITTNGTLTAPHVATLKSLGIASVNLSLDTLRPEQFKAIARRDGFEQTWSTFEQLVEHKIPVKINAVVMEGKNIDDIIPLIELTRTLPVSVRFIEEMPFNGEGSHYPILTWTYTRILEYIRKAYPSIQKVADPANATAYHYKIDGFVGNIGIIAAFSRTFCGTCNRIRVTSQGTLKTCLYDEGTFDLRKLMREGGSNDHIREALLQAFSNRPKDGFEAEHKRKKHVAITESMSAIGG